MAAGTAGDVYTGNLYKLSHLAVLWNQTFFLFLPRGVSDTLTAVPECDFMDRYLVAEVV